MEKVHLPPKYRYFAAPHPAVVIGTLVHGKPTYNTVGDFGITCANPLHIYVASVKTHYTNQGIHEHGTFSVNIPSEGQLVATDYVGAVSGHSTDKSAVFDHFFGDLKSAPLISEMPVNLECEVLHTLLVGTNEVFIGTVTGIYAQKDVMEGERMDIERVNPITLFMDSSYRTIGKPVGTAYGLAAQFRPKPSP